MATGKKMGRPLGDTLYPNKELIKDEIVAWLSEGKTLRDYCRQDKRPSFRTIYDWEAQDKDFATRIARARDIGSDSIADECLAIIDAEPLAIFDEAGNKRYDSGSIAWNKNRAEQRIKLLAKWNPRKYGDKTIVSGDNENPVAVEVSFDVFGELLKNIALTRQTSE
jgi:hypothetical protein